MNLKEMKEMLQLMADHGLTEIEIEKDGLKVKLKKGTVLRESSDESSGFKAGGPGVSAGRPELQAIRPTSSPKALEDNPDVFTVKSPMVGTFYASPAPDQAAYVSAGKKVKEGEVLCIVEAMKLMNEIKSEMTGTILEVFVKNGQPVEFDQPLFKMKKG